VKIFDHCWLQDETFPIYLSVPCEEEEHKIGPDCSPSPEIIEEEIHMSLVPAPRTREKANAENQETSEIGMKQGYSETICLLKGKSLIIPINTSKKFNPGKALYSRQTLPVPNEGNGLSRIKATTSFL
jgi:hypothetical protein